MVGTQEQAVQGSEPRQVRQRSAHPQPYQPTAAEVTAPSHRKAQLSSWELLLSLLEYLLSAALRWEPGIGVRQPDLLWQLL